MATVYVFADARRRKVALVPGDPFYTARARVNNLRRNYINTPRERIREGIRILGEVLSAFV